MAAATHFPGDRPKKVTRWHQQTEKLFDSQLQPFGDLITGSCRIGQHGALKKGKTGDSGTRNLPILKC